MTDTGAMGILKAREYEDATSLKKYIKSGIGNGKFDGHYYNEIITNFNITTTGATADEIELDDGITITQIGKTELTMVGAMSANDNDYDGYIATMVYLDQDGVSHTATCTIDTTDSTTEVAFVDAATGLVAVIDFYSMVSLSLGTDAPKAGNTFGCGTTGVLTYGVIQATANDAVEADMYGVGAVYGRSHTDHADADATVHYMEYITPWGAIKWGHCTLTATSSDEIRYFEGTYSATTDLVTATTTTVKDFYRTRRMWQTTAPTSNSHEYLLCDADAAVDGSGLDVYGIILEGMYESIKPRYMVPAGYSAWVAKWCVQAPQSAVADSYTFETIFTPAGSSVAKHEVFEFVEWTEHSCPALLEELSEVVFYVTDLATADNLSGYIWIIEIKNNG